MSLALKTAVDPTQVLAMLSVAELKESLRISYAKEDAYIQACILEAYDWLAGEHGWLNRSVLASTWVQTMPAFVPYFEFAKPPLYAVSSVKYLADTVLTTVDPSVYVVDLVGANGFGNISLGVDQVWPSPVDAGADAVQIEFIAGLGLGTGADVKAKHPALVRALKLLAGDYFRVREDTYTDTRVSEVDRRVVNDVARVAGRYRFFNDVA